MNIVDARCEQYILNTHPHVTTEMIQDWRRKYTQKILEPFVWVDYNLYDEMM